MRIFMSLILLAAQPALAFQFGTGMAPGMQCPSGYGMAPGAYNGNDEISNLAGNLRNGQAQLKMREDKLRRMNSEIAAAKTKIRRVIKSQNALDDIERHYRYGANPDDYSQSCGPRERGGPGGSAGSSSSSIVHAPGRSEVASGRSDPGRYAIPVDYCVAGQNQWKYLVAENGMMNEAVCDYEVPFIRRPPDEERIQECREGMSQYYARMAQKKKLEQEVRDLRSKLNRYNEDKERIQDEIAEGTYCYNCQRRGQAQLGSDNFAMMGFSLMINLMNRQPQPRPVLMAVPRMGPQVMPPYGGGYGAPQMGFPGGAAYLGRPYAAPTPGYYGVQPGMYPGQGIYGAMPGGVGAGGFGCQGTSPFSFGNPLAQQYQPFQNGGANPFANPYTFPFAQQHPLLNPGYGPSFMPMLGNGLQSGGIGPGGFGLAGAQMLPYPGYGGNGFGPGGYGGVGPGGFGFGGPQMMPYPGYGNGYGNGFGNGYGGFGLGGPQMMPYPNYSGGVGAGGFGFGGPQMLPAYPGYGGGSAPYMTNMPWAAGGAPYALSPTQNFGYQMGQMRNNINMIGGGSYSAPPVMPFLGSPSYSSQPMPPPRSNPPAIVPAR